MNKEIFIRDIKKEFERASKPHPEFHSYHEGIAVIHEEFIELRTEVYKRIPNRQAMQDELTQLAAMCIKFSELL